MLSNLSRNPSFQYAYLLCAVCLLAVIHYTESTQVIPQFVITILLVIHGMLLIMKVLAPRLFNRLLNPNQVPNFRSSISEKTIPRRNPNDIYVLEAADSRFMDIERTLINGVNPHVKRVWQEDKSTNKSVSPFFEKRNIQRRDLNQGEVFYSMEGVNTRRQPMRANNYIQQDYLRRMGQYSRNDREQRKQFELNSHLPQSSPDAVYTKAGLKVSQKLKMLNLLRDHIRYLSENQQVYTAQLDEQIQFIFGQRLSEEPGPNNISLAEVGKLLRWYSQYQSVPKEYFRGIKAQATDYDFNREMRKLQVLFQDVPPKVNLSNRKSVFNFYLWFVRKMLLPEKVEVFNKLTYVERPYQTANKIIIEDTIGGMYFVFKEQVDCQYNVEETFLFTLMSGRPKETSTIVRQLLRINRDGY